MAGLGVGPLVTVVYYDLSMIHILLKGKRTAACLLLGNSVVIFILSYYKVHFVNVLVGMSQNLLMPWH